MTPHKSAPLHRGERIGDYEVVKKIGGGGFGTTYRVRNLNLGRDECLKISHRNSAVDLDEARMIAGLGLDGIAAVHGSGTHEGRAWYTMILADQGDLHHYLRRLPGPLADDTRLRMVIDLIGQVARTLDHLAGLPSPVAHGDIKPRNILVHAAAGSPRALVADFGLARATTAEPGESTATWTKAGTPEYIAPEMWSGTSPATPATDRYALACTAFAAVTGRTAFDVGDYRDRSDRLNRARLAQLNPDRPVPGRIDPGLARFDPVFRRALALDPADRHPTATAFHADLVAALERPARRRRRILTGAIAGVGVAVVAAAAVLAAPVLLSAGSAPGGTAAAKANDAIPTGICPPLAVAANLRGPHGDTTFHSNPLELNPFIIDRPDTPAEAPDIPLDAVNPDCLIAGPSMEIDGSVPGDDQARRSTFLAVFNSDEDAVLSTRDELLALIDSDGNHDVTGTWRGLEVRLAAGNERIRPGRPTAACVLDDPERHFTVVELHLGSEGSARPVGGGKPASEILCNPAEALIEKWNQTYVPRSSNDRP